MRTNLVWPSFCSPTNAAKSVDPSRIPSNLSLDAHTLRKGVCARHIADGQGTVSNEDREGFAVQAGVCGIRRGLAFLRSRHVKHPVLGRFVTTRSVDPDLADALGVGRELDPEATGCDGSVWGIPDVLGLSDCVGYGYAMGGVERWRGDQWRERERGVG